MCKLRKIRFGIIWDFDLFKILIFIDLLLLLRYALYVYDIV